MLEKIMAKFKRKDSLNRVESSVNSVPETVPSLDKDLEADRIYAERMTEKIANLDDRTKAAIENFVKKEFDSRFHADPSNPTECFALLEDIYSDLCGDLLLRSEIERAYGRELASIMLEEKLVSIGKSLDEYYDWVVNESDDELDSDEFEEMEEELSGKMKF